MRSSLLLLLFLLLLAPSLHADPPDRFVMQRLESNGLRHVVVLDRQGPTLLVYEVTSAGALRLTSARSLRHDHLITSLNDRSPRELRPRELARQPQAQAADAAQRRRAAARAEQRAAVSALARSATRLLDGLRGFGERAGRWFGGR